MNPKAVDPVQDNWQAFDALATLFVVTDAPGRIAYVNTAFEDQIGRAHV